MITHHKGCTSNYLEKPAGEPPQKVSRDWTDDGYWIDACVDCGAFETNLPPGDDPYWDDVRDELKEMER